MHGVMMVMSPRHSRTRPGAHAVRRARTPLAIAVLGAAALAAAIGLMLSGGPGSAAAVANTISRSPAPTARLAQSTAQARPTNPTARLQVAASTELATVRIAGPGFARPGAPATGTVATSWHERPSVLPVIATEPGWVEVRLPQRPNESTAWLPAADVTLSATSYEIVVDLATTRLSLYDGGRLVFSAPAGVGATGDPTPAGHYFVAFDEHPPQPNPGYGPFIIVTSAHSPAISDWEGSGDAVIGIHGPLGEDSQIGPSGAKISHGCIRLHDQALERLAEVPPGTPIDIVS